MNKKLLFTVVLFMISLLTFAVTYSFATDGNGAMNAVNDAANEVRNVVGSAENTVEGAVDGIGVQLLHLRNGLAVETEQFGGTVDHRGELLQYPRVCKGLDNHFISYAVGVTLGDTYDDFGILHILNFIFFKYSTLLRECVSAVFGKLRCRTCFHCKPVATLVLGMAGVTLDPDETCI